MRNHRHEADILARYGLDVRTGERSTLTVLGEFCSWLATAAAVFLVAMIAAGVI